MKYFFESSIEDLYKSTVRAFPRTTKRQHAVHPIVVEQLRCLPFLGVRTLFIKGHTRNENRHYDTIILFKNVDYTKNEVKVTAIDGKTYNFAKISFENNDVSLRCNCPDFNWRFNYYNSLDKSLYGTKRSKYEGHGMPANPLQLPGMCKHIMATTKALNDAGIFLD
jgi:hypothetical protein